MNLVEMLTGSLASESSINSLAKKTGGSSGQISKLVMVAIPVLIGYLTKNASKKDGASSLLSALGQHQNTNALASQVADADEVDGGKILQHILGGDTSSVVSSLSKETGMDSGQVSQVLGNITPALMSGLSAATTTASKSKSGFDLSDGLDMGDLMSLMGGSKSTSPSSTGDLLGGLLGGSGGSSLLSGLLGGGSSKKSATDGSDLLGMLTALMK